MKRHHMTVGDLMITAVIALHEGDTLEQAQLDMKLARIRHIPVIDDKGHVVGILSNRDFARAGGAKAGRQVGEIMTRRVETVSVSTPAHQASERMLRLKIGSLPVVSEDQRLVGIVTETDFLRLAHRALGGEPLGV